MKKALIAGTCLIMVITAVYLANSVAINKSYSKARIMESPVNISDIKVKTMDGSEKQLSDYNGKVLMIVNVASKCGFTPQYTGLEKIYETYKNKGFEILAFPCNDFHSQEPGTNDEIIFPWSRQLCCPGNRQSGMNRNQSDRRAYAP